MATPVGFVKTGYVTAGSAPGASSVPVYKKLGGKYMKFYTISGGKPTTDISQQFPVKNASGTVKKLGAFLKAKAKTPTAPSPAKAKSPLSVNNLNQNKNTGNYYYKGTKNKVPYTTMLKKSNGTLSKAISLQIAYIEKKTANMSKAATSPNKNTGFFTATGHPIKMKNSNAYYKPPTLGTWIPLKSNTTILYKTSTGGKVGTLGEYLKDPTAFAAKAKSPVNTMAGYTKTNLKIGALNVYKKNSDYFYKKTNGQPQKLGQASKVTKPNGTSKPIKVLNYNKTNLKFGSMNVYKNAAGNYYYTNLYTANKPHKMGKNLEVTKPNGTKASLASLNVGAGQGQYHRMTGMVTKVNPVYYRIEPNGKVRFYYNVNDIYNNISPSYEIFKDTDTAFAHPFKVGDYFQQSNNVYKNTGKTAGGKVVYKHKHMSDVLAIKNGNKYLHTFQGKKAVEKNLGIVKVPKATAAKAVTPVAAPPVVVTVTLVPVLRVVQTTRTPTTRICVQRATGWPT